MKKSFRCVNCDNFFVLDHNTFTKQNADFDGRDYRGNRVDYGEKVVLEFYQCPSCGYMHIKLFGVGELLKGKIINIRPLSDAKVFPNYIPETIRNDYQEAFNILYYSPRASAVLARRCLQAIIRDIYNPITKKEQLWEEIESIKSQIPTSLFKALNAVRNVGNIGAHPESDVLADIQVTSEEAKQLLLVIELLFRSLYIDKKEEEDLIAKVIDIGEDKKDQKEKSKAVSLTKS